ncbi:MAG: esterase family protein [Clostridiales bacterium]|jgi:S-formylglutathione hydrolase FrmB|nr:esterase family protein [Clostridiales bacterium]
MALLKVNFKSDALSKATEFHVILPEKRASGVPLPVLYLLHGYSDDHSAWCAQTSVERYVRNRNIAVVMPDGFKSFYTDMVGGVYNCYTYLTRELPAFAQENFNLSARREDNYIAGLSMGGYGAFKIALSQPGNFCAAASFSGSLDIARSARDADFSAIFASPPQNTPDDLFFLAKREMPVKPRLYQWCGTEDHLYADNARFRDYIQNLGFDYTYRESAGGHQWRHWDEQLRKIFAWFGIPQTEE